MLLGYFCQHSSCQMGHTIPVYFMPIEQCAKVEGLSTYGDALTLLLEYDEWKSQPQKFGLVETASRNWWHQSTLTDICNAMDLDTLDFLIAEHFVCLSPEQVKAALRSLEKAISIIVRGLPNLGEFDSEDVKIVRLNRGTDSLEDAAPSYDIDADDSVTSFYTFIQSLRRALQDALAHHQYLLYMRPLP